MQYSFNLKFYELDKKLQDQKIDEVILYDFENGNLDEERYTDANEAMSDLELREATEQYIRSHFPIYF